jgi:hypothetical protein
MPKDDGRLTMDDGTVECGKTMDDGQLTTEDGGGHGEWRGACQKMRDAGYKSRVQDAD